MPREQLRSRLAELHTELERTHEVDADSRRLLGEVLEDIHKLLEEEEGAHEPPSLVERLREATRDFEEAHPQLAATVGRVVDTLANMGI